MIIIEEWKAIENYEGYYEISNFGNVRNSRTGRTLKLNDRGNGYFCCTLSKNNIRKNQSVHRLVAKAFIDNPEGKQEVNHIDGNKFNNHVDNLEWTTRSENETHAMNNGLCKYNKPVIATNVATGESIEFRSVHQAAQHFGMYKRCVEAVLSGQRKTHHGYTFEYKDRDEFYNNEDDESPRGRSTHTE